MVNPIQVTGFGVPIFTPPAQCDSVVPPASMTTNARGPSLQVCRVKRVIPGTRTVVVGGSGIIDAPCIFIPGMIAQIIGAKDCGLPTEGTLVLTVVLPEDAKTHIAICTLPSDMRGFKDSEGLPLVQMDGAAPESGADYWAAKSYTEVAQDPKLNASQVPCPDDRPWNMLPGEWAQANPFGVMVGVLHLLAVLKGSERAKIECFVLDDLVRLTSGQFEHWHALGETSIFTDGLYNMLESGGSQFYPETLGKDKSGDSIFSEDDKGASAEQSRYKQDDEKLRMKLRHRLFFGGVADMLQFYVKNMAGEPGDPDNPQKGYGGAFKLHLDGRGALNVQSAAGIGMSLNDVIPVPERVKAPWDPEGDQPEMQDTPFYDKKKHYDYGNEPYIRSLAAIDAELYEDARSLARFDKHAKDFKTAQPSEVTKPLRDTYNEVEDTAGYQKDRRAGWRIEGDGSVRLWDAWGSEIYMRGGDIVFGCPGHFIIQSGKGIVGLGDQVVLKARTSADITAETKDVRIAAGQSVYTYARDGGIMLHTDSTGPSFREGKGEDKHITGIILKAPKAHIVVLTDTFITICDAVKMYAKTATTFMGGALQSAVKRMRLQVMGTSGISATENGLQVLAPNVQLAAGTGISLVKGTRMADIKWIDVNPPVNAYDDRVKSYESLQAEYGTVSDGETLPPALERSYKPEYTDLMRFEYRTSLQYGTDRGIEIDQPASSFRLYQARWQRMVTAGSAMIQGTAQEWQEAEVNGTYPWPGLDARPGGYITMPDKFDNSDDAGITPKDRTLLTDTAAGLAPKSMDKYITISHN